MSESSSHAPLRPLWEELKRRQQLYELENAVQRLFAYVQYGQQNYGIGKEIKVVYGLHDRKPVGSLLLPPDRRFLLRFYQVEGKLSMGLASGLHEVLLQPTDGKGQPLDYDQQHVVNLTRLVMEALSLPYLITKGEPQRGVELEHDS